MAAILAGVERGHQTVNVESEGLRLNTGVVIGNAQLGAGAIVSSHLYHAPSTFTVVILPCLAATSVAISVPNGR